MKKYLNLPFLIVGFLFLILSVAYLLGSLMYPVGSLAQPGPGIYPFVVGMLLILCSVGMLFASLGDKKERALFPMKKELERLLAIVMSMTLFAIFLKPLGYIICCFLFMEIVFYLFDMRRLVLGFVISALISVSSYWLFYFLETPLPQGILPW